VTKIDKDTTIEEIVEEHPELVRPMQEMGIQCMVCGEPVWGTLEEKLKEKGMADKMTEIIVKLNSLADEK